MKISRLSLLVSLISMWMVAGAFGQLAVVSRLPDQNGKSVCVDTHLNITFNAPPTLGKTGTIRIYDAADNKLVDTLDVSLPTSQQTYVIGGSNLHAYPVIITEKTAVIYPHNNTLAYGKTYYVQIDSGVLTQGDQPFPGYSGDKGWVFSTKDAPPTVGTDRVVVAADGSGDFATVQGAVDFVPENNTTHLTIFIKKGTYTEIVSFVGKNNVTFLGEDRDQTIVAYSNNNNFQPNLATPQTPFGGASYRRGVFMGLNSSDVVLANFTIRNTTRKGGSQAEAIVFKEARGQKGPNTSQTILAHMNLYSFQDTLQISGKAYLDDTYIEGDTDYMWGNGPCYFVNCSFKTLTNRTSFTQTRNTADHHGFVFVDSKFDGRDGVSTATLGNGSGASEVVLINCALGKMLAPTGWNSRGANNAEFNTTNLSDGNPYDMSMWPDWVKHLTMEKDAQAIGNYRNPTWVLEGWTPVVPTIAATQPK
jgi:pectin methylesterase-like acyl-CoA thioesterase